MANGSTRKSPMSDARDAHCTQHAGGANIRVASAASQGPKEVCVRATVGNNNGAVRQHYFKFGHQVDAKAVAARMKQQTTKNIVKDDSLQCSFIHGAMLCTYVLVSLP